MASGSAKTTRCDGGGLETGEALLRATGLGRCLGDAWIWRAVDVQLHAGENLAILGPTGAGKSLLLRCLAGLDAADEGRIAVDDDVYRNTRS